MEVGEKLKELDMTADEIDRLTKAFKDDKFREMLRDYAEELADPENKRRYEEEIKLLEQERGNNIEFIHPEPFKSLKTSVNGKQKCFINICASDKIGKPSCENGVREQGRRGQCWSLPHSLHPGRQDTDPKGNKMMIYDVIFHPDALYLAKKNKRFMDMVENTAIQGIQDAFKVTLDKNNVRQMKSSYKGTPQPCVIRKPIPGYKAKDPPEKPDPLAFPYPDEKTPSTSSQTKPTDSPETNNSNDVKPASFHIQSQKTKEPTKPNYTIKYRSFIDLQDFRCSRDSGRSPRPKEIVVTIDMPLLKSITDTSLEVNERSLLLDSKKPAYRLELPLAYPVDEDKGEAKFNRQKGQLTVTLPVLPSKEAFDLALGPAMTVTEAQGVSDEEGEERDAEEEKVEKEMEVEEEDLKQTVVEKCEDEEGGDHMGKGQENGKLEESVGECEEENLRKQEKEREKSKDEETGSEEAAKWQEQIRHDQDSVVEDIRADTDNESTIEEDKLQEQNQEHTCDTGEGGDINLNSCLESTPQINSSDSQEAEKTNNKNIQVSEQVR